MNLNEKIKKANEILDSFGGKAVLVDRTRRGFTSIGYKGGYLLESLNQAIGAENWRHVVHSTEFFDSDNKDGGKKTNVVTKISIQILEDNKVVFESGIQVGGAFVVHGNVSDAIKSSISDGIGKSLSLLGLGSKAYRGELKASDATTVVKEDGIEEELANEINTHTMTMTTVTTEDKPVVTTTPRFSGFKTKSNGSAGAPENKSTEVATTRFRSPGLTAKASS